MKKYILFAIASLIFSATIAQPGKNKKDAPKTETKSEKGTISYKTDTLKVRIYVDVLEDGSQYVKWMDGFAIRTLLDDQPIEGKTSVQWTDKTWATIKERVKEGQPFNWK
jgi:hypothetical protein